MRVMAKVVMPVESGNRGIKDGTMGKLMQTAAERWHPEAMYFTTFDGRRSAYMVFDLPNASDIPPRFRAYRIMQCKRAGQDPWPLSCLAVG